MITLFLFSVYCVQQNEEEQQVSESVSSCAVTNRSIGQVNGPSS